MAGFKEYSWTKHKVRKLYPDEHLSRKEQGERMDALNDFESFINLVAPYQILGACHSKLARWITNTPDENKLILWPRDHGKSRIAAFYAVWEIVRDPAICIIYGSATAEKAQEQLRFMQDILTSETFTYYFPGLVNVKESARKAWNKTTIIVDHPARDEHGVVDSTIMTCGVEKNITGKHCDKLILDDIITHKNTVQEGASGRKKVNDWFAQAASIMSADSQMFVVGTRYHPNDAYSLMLEMEYTDHEEDENGVVQSESRSLFAVDQKDVEVKGKFLWPRKQEKNGKWFGFNKTILAKKKAIYEANGNITQFYAQYYNEPNDKTTAPIARDSFQYYQQGQLTQENGLWTIGGVPLDVYAGFDMAYSTGKKSDWSCIVIGGINPEGVRYLMDIIRFKTDSISEMKRELEEAYNKFMYRKLTIEAVSAAKLAAKELKLQLHEEGIRVPVELYVPTSHDGSKEARINSILEPLYQSNSIFHFEGGDIGELEDELVSMHPAHDDIKDSWALCNQSMKKPIRRRVHSKRMGVNGSNNVRRVQFNSRFGGVAR